MTDLEREGLRSPEETEAWVKEAAEEAVAEMRDEDGYLDNTSLGC